MSQQPNPPLQYYGAPIPQRGYPMPRWSSARRTAFIVQTILGGVLLLMGTCAGAIYWFFPDVMTAVFHQQAANMPGGAEFSDSDIRRLVELSRGVAIFLGSAGVILLTLGFFVLHGNRIATRISMTLTILVGVLFLLDIFGGLPQLGSNPVVILGLAVLGGLLGLCVLSIFKLFAAMKAIILMPATAQPQMIQVPMPYGYGPSVGYPPPPPPGAGPLGTPRG